jgi:3-phenylpropionate/trans-cinnamate dioxygenase ferredoxin subunit
VSAWHAVEPPTSAEDGHLHAARVAGVDLVLVRVDGAWHALADECSHAGCSLSDDGELYAGVLICNCHGSEFSPLTGALVTGPADEPLATYPVRVVEGRVEVEV